MFTAIACVCVLLVDTAISVMAADVNADRLQLALRMKADVIVNTLTDDLSQVDLVQLLYFHARRDIEWSANLHLVPIKVIVFIESLMLCIYVDLVARSESLLR